MNAAYRKIDALTALSQYTQIIALHITYLATFPENEAANHWKKEINAFKKTLKRLDKGKSKKGWNFAVDTIEDAIIEEIDTPDKQDNFQMIIESKGLVLPEEGIDWGRVESAIKDFAKEIGH